MPKTRKSDVYQIVTDQIVALLEGGTVPWHKPWDPSIGRPLSMSTRKAYRGINPFLLACSAAAAGYSSPWWGTYDQITERGGQVRKGEQSTLIVFWKTGTREVTDEATGQETEKRWAVLRYFRVFNAEQADGLDERWLKAPDGHDTNPIGSCEELVASYLADGPSLAHGGNAAFYSPGRDHVQLPPIAAFTDAAEYYSTMFHELTHSTGHGSRLNREGIVEGHSFGDELYSREELIAEMGAAMLCGVAGIEQTTVTNSAAYLASWIKVLKGDAKLAVAAAGQAQRACDLILGTTFEAEAEDVNQQAA
jgi:antirestriction protein ArdC